MKAGLIVLVMAVLGVGEYAFVEYYPLSPERRLQKVQKLPIARSFVKAAELRVIRTAIEESDSGYVSVLRDGEFWKWDDAKKLYADAKEGNRAARTVLGRIRESEKYKVPLEKLRKEAEAGDPLSMMTLYLVGKSRTYTKDMERAVELLEAHESALAKSILYQSIGRSGQMPDRESMLLFSRVAIENYRRPGTSDLEYERQTQQAEKQLDMLKQAAADGDEDAQWAVEQLTYEDPTMIRAESGKLEPAFMLEMAKHAVFDLKAHFSVGDEQMQEEYKNGIPGPDGDSYYPPTMKLYFYHKEAGHPDSVTREYMYMVTDAALSSAFWTFMDDEQKAKVRAERERIASETAALARAGDERALWVRARIMEARRGLDIMEKY